MSSNGVFVNRSNPVTGQIEWVVMPDDYDYQQEISCSSYGDMLHDTARNKAYYHGLRVAVSAIRARGEPIRVLDIGTGSGLLSMMAAKLGADEITACEAFEPVARCAQQVIKANSLSDRIKLVHKTSTELKVGIDLTHKANLLVAEVFDTDLIGEAALHTFTHALEHLVTGDCLVVPSRAHLYAQVFHSDLLSYHHRLNSSSYIPFTNSSIECPGLSTSHDIQISELKPGSDFTLMSEPVLVKTFDFTPKTVTIGDGDKDKPHSLLMKDTKSIPVTLTTDCIAQPTGVFVWWDLEMHPFVTKDKDLTSLDVLSCCPRWHNAKAYNWRDHWMQAVCYFQRPLVSPSESLDCHLIYHHDPFANHFDLTNVSNPRERSLQPVVCHCGVHVAYCRTRLTEMQSENYIESMKTWLSATDISDHQNVLVLSDGGSPAFILSHILPNSSKISLIEENPISYKSVSNVIEESGLADRIKLFKNSSKYRTSCNETESVLVVAEPYFICSVLPWHDMHFWYTARGLLKSGLQLSSVLPCQIIIKCVLYSFTDLWKIRAPVGTCEGFDLTLFDVMVEGGCRDDIEAHYLWEYPGVVTSEPVTLFNLSFSQFCKAWSSQEFSLNFDASISDHTTLDHKTNACVLWCDWISTDGSVVQSSGPTSSCHPGDKPVWNRYRKQAVHFLSSLSPSEVHNIDAAFNLENCELSLRVK